MSGQDEKIGIIETARNQYDALMRTLRRANPDPYSLMPAELEEAVRQYEGFGAINKSMKFRNALGRYWEGIDVPRKLKPDIKRIAEMSIFDDGWWGPNPERYR